jgi:hypothetical protein
MLLGSTARHGICIPHVPRHGIAMHLRVSCENRKRLEAVTGTIQMRSMRGTCETSSDKETQWVGRHN